MSVSSFFCREFKIRLRRDLQIFTDNFRAENSEFDPAKVVEGDVQGRVCWVSYFEHLLYMLQVKIKFKLMSQFL